MDISVGQARDALYWKFFDLGFNYDEKVEAFTDGEVEYHLTNYTNGDFSGIFINFCDDVTHSYKEFKEYEYAHLDDLFYAATDIDVIPDLGSLVNRRLEDRIKRFKVE